MSFFNPFISDGGGGGGSSANLTITKYTDSQTGKITFKLENLDAGSAQVGDTITFDGNGLLIDNPDQTQGAVEEVSLQSMIDYLYEKSQSTYNFTTFTELNIDTHNKTLKQLTNELIAKNLSQNTIVTGQIYSAALPFSGNGEVEVLVNHPTYWWTCKSLNVAPYSWNALTATSTQGDDGIVVDWTPDNYTLPVATSSTLGGVKIGNNINVTQDGTISINVDSAPTSQSQNLITSGGVAEAINEELATKVDKVPGKGLSTNDFTNADKANLATALEKANAAAPQSTTYNKTEVDTALAAKLNTADVDDALSSTSTNPVQNKAVQAPVARLVDAGAKNLLKITATSQTINGVTFTVNDDGTITAIGTASANTVFTLNTIPAHMAETYNGFRLTGCPTGGSASTYRLAVTLNSSPYTNYASDVGGGSVIRNAISSECRIAIYVYSGTAVNLLFKPMICTVEDYAISSEFVPYAPSNRDLYEEVKKKADILPTDRRATDINTTVDPGMYRFYGAGATANLPSDMAGTAQFGLLEVFVCGVYIKQVLTHFKSSAQAVPPTIYIRRSVDSGASWGPWGKFVGTEVN